MTDDVRDSFGTAGRGLVATAWVLAFCPVAVFFFNFSPKTNYRWLWDALPVLLWGSPVSTLACAIALTRCETTDWKKLLGWMAVGMSLFMGPGLMLGFRGI
jgi:hypothetical protein